MQIDSNGTMRVNFLSPHKCAHCRELLFKGVLEEEHCGGIGDRDFFTCRECFENGDRLLRELREKAEFRDKLWTEWAKENRN